MAYFGAKTLLGRPNKKFLFSHTLVRYVMGGFENELKKEFFTGAPLDRIRQFWRLISENDGRKSLILAKNWKLCNFMARWFCAD